MPEEEDYDSGPFCRHWMAPQDCDEPCARCGHACGYHSLAREDSACFATDCGCPAWIEAGLMDVPPKDLP